MHLMQKWNRLGWPERWLLVKSALLLAGIRLCLSLLPFDLVRRKIWELARPTVGLTGDGSGKRIVWAIQSAGRYMPAAGTCLTQAFAAQLLLGRRGFATSLRVGVARGPNGALRAHAWLEKDGIVVIGGMVENLAGYTPLPSFDTRS